MQGRDELKIVIKKMEVCFFKIVLSLNLQLLQILLLAHLRQR